MIHGRFHAVITIPPRNVAEKLAGGCDEVYATIRRRVDTG
jgi:hypothetical protein